MLAVYTKLKNAEKVKLQIIKKGILNTDYQVVKEFGIIYFPITKKIKILNAKTINTKFEFPKIKRAVPIEELLKGKLTAREMKLIPRALEIIGQIMVLEVPTALVKKEKVIAEAYLEQNKNITTVVKKEAIHSGTFRLRKVKVLAGKRIKETIHYENGVKIKLNLEKTYFSARSSNERLRIAKQVKSNEQVLVMFSGAGPYPLVIAKNSPAKIVYGLEMNPAAHQYALINVTLNKLEDKVTILEGDVRTFLPKMTKKFDRIVMPLPKTGEQFLDLTLKKTKKNGMIHLYSFLDEQDFKKYAQKVREICKKNKREIRILKKVKCGQFSPRVFRVCFDIKILS